VCRTRPAAPSPTHCRRPWRVRWVAPRKFRDLDAPASHIADTSDGARRKIHPRQHHRQSEGCRSADAETDRRWAAVIPAYSHGSSRIPQETSSPRSWGGGSQPRAIAPVSARVRQLRWVIWAAGVASPAIGADLDPPGGRAIGRRHIGPVCGQPRIGWRFALSEVCVVGLLSLLPLFLFDFGRRAQVPARLGWKRRASAAAPPAPASGRSDRAARCWPATCRPSNMCQRGCGVSDRCSWSQRCTHLHLATRFGIAVFGTGASNRASASSISPSR